MRKGTERSASAAGGGSGFFLLSVRAVPNAKKTQFAGTVGGSVKIKIQAVPEGGRANEELEAFLAGTLSLPKRGVSVVRGETSRDKVLRIDGCSREAAFAAWGFPPPDSAPAGE